MSETPLSNSRWKMHGIDIAERGALARLGTTPLRSGDEAFDARFTVWQDGMVVREHWLDAPTRAAVSAFFDQPAVKGGGTVWVQEGLLQYINDTPRTLDAAALSAILDQQSRARFGARQDRGDSPLSLDAPADALRSVTGGQNDDERRVGWPGHRVERDRMRSRRSRAGYQRTVARITASNSGSRFRKTSSRFGPCSSPTTITTPDARQAGPRPRLRARRHD